MSPLQELLTSKFPAMPQSPPGWNFSLDSVNEWRPRDEKHPAYSFVQAHLYEPGTVFDWSQIPENVKAVCVPVLYTRDVQGFQLSDCRIEPRFVRVGEKFTGGDPFVVSVAHWVMHRPLKALEALEAGFWSVAMEEAKKGESKLHRSIFLKAREQLERAQALAAFKTLFQYYSFNEELWRLERWMEEYLPFDLDEHPEMQKYRELLQVQVGHLREGGRISPRAVSKHYAGESPPAEGFGPEVMKSAPLQARHKWLIEQCNKEKYVKVAEWGSINATSLVALSRFAPHIDWYGFESNPKCREVGIRTALDAGFVVNGMGDELVMGTRPPLGKFQLLPMVDLYKYKEFDAVSLFEVLEHNDEEGDIEIITECFSSIRKGGTLYITTPCGNWSGFDDKYCRDLSTRKDHINAFTPLRMAKLLKKAVRAYGGGTFELLECYRVENPELTENNAWVHAAVKRIS